MSSRIWPMINLMLIALISFGLGFSLSKLVDGFFTPCDFKRKDSRIVFETLLEFSIAMLLYSVGKKYILFFYKKISKSHLSSSLLSSIIALSFSYGIFEKLDGISENTRYLKEKYIKWNVF